MAASMEGLHDFSWSFCFASASCVFLLSFDYLAKGSIPVGFAAVGDYVNFFLGEYCFCELFVYLFFDLSNLASHGSSNSLCSSNVEILLLALPSLTFVVLVLSCTVWLITDSGIADFGSVSLVALLLALYKRRLQWLCSLIVCTVWCLRVLLLLLRYHSQLCRDCCGLTVHAPSG
jgi:hypothetical protein